MPRFVVMVMVAAVLSVRVVVLVLGVVAFLALMMVAFGVVAVLAVMWSCSESVALELHSLGFERLRSR